MRATLLLPQWYVCVTLMLTWNKQTHSLTNWISSMFRFLESIPFQHSYFFFSPIQFNFSNHFSTLWNAMCFSSLWMCVLSLFRYKTQANQIHAITTHQSGIMLVGNRHERISLANCNNIAKNGIKPNKYSDFIERFCWKKNSILYKNAHRR